MMMSPASMWSASSFTAAPVPAAGTITHAARGDVSLPARSATEVAPMAPWLSKSATTSSWWS